MNYKFIFGLFLIGLISLSFSYDSCPKAYGSEPICTYWVQINQICKDGWGMDPYFVAAIAHKESDFNTFSVNEEEKLAYESGNPMWCGQYYGKGIMQLTGPGVAGIPYPNPKNWQYDMPPGSNPATAPYMDDPFNSAQSFNRACWFLKSLYDHYSGDLNKVASAYRYGWQDVDKLEVDPNNNNYVQGAMKYYNYYKMNSVPEQVAQPVVTQDANTAPVQQEQTQAPAQTQPTPDNQTSTTTTTTTTQDNTNTQTTQTSTEQQAQTENTSTLETTPEPEPSVAPQTEFCNKLKDYLEQKYDNFFKKIYVFLGKDYYQAYCENVYYPLISNMPNQFKKIKAKIGIQ